MIKRKGDSYLGGHTIWPSRALSPDDNDLTAKSSKAFDAKEKARKRAPRKNFAQRIWEADAIYFVRNLSVEVVAGMPASIRICIEQSNNSIVAEQLNVSNYLKDCVGMWNSELVSIIKERTLAVARGKLIAKRDAVAVHMNRQRKNATARVKKGVKVI
jgi:hypothetical protein